MGVIKLLVEDSIFWLFFSQRNRPVLIVAEDLESELLNMLIINKHRAGLKVRSLRFSV